MKDTLDTIVGLDDHADDKSLIPFCSFVENEVKEDPKAVFRNVFQYLDDMVRFYVGDGEEEYPDDPELIDFKSYDTSKLLESSAEPFFADRVFANKFIRMVSSMRSSAKQNKVYIFEGPAGSGKTLFINNLLDRLEEYSTLDEGKMFETVWKIDPALFKEGHKSHIGFTSDSDTGEDETLELNDNRSIIVPCPNHSNPVLHIPKDRRTDFLDSVIDDEDFKARLFNDKEYEWLFKDEASPISSSIFEALLDKTGDLKKVYRMLHARRYTFDRKRGNGINVYNAGDRHYGDIRQNEFIQKQLNRILKDSTLVNYMYSSYANSNNGVYVIMDLKDNNKRRLTDLHGIISDGIKRVDNMEESISSIFFVTKNLEDRVDEAEDMRESFKDRVELLRLARIVDYQTEVKIYKKTFGEDISQRFHPGVLESFARYVVGTRLDDNHDAISAWITDASAYQHRCDKNFKILKMELYSGNKPRWLTKEDYKKFSSDASVKRAVIEESAEEGLSGFSVRRSINELNELLGSQKNERQISIRDIYEYIVERFSDDDDVKDMPDDFLEALVRNYDYEVLDQMKDSLFSYNRAEMKKDIMDYLVAITSEKDGQEIISPLTGKRLRITEEYLAAKEAKIFGPGVERDERIRSMYRYRNMLARDIARLDLEDKKIADHITRTEFYKEIMEDYKSNAREHVLDELITNDSFKDAIENYDTDRFRIYDGALRENVTRLIENMVEKYGYTTEGAKDVCSYILDNKNMIYSTIFSQDAKSEE